MCVSHWMDFIPRHTPPSLCFLRSAQVARHSLCPSMKHGWKRTQEVRAKPPSRERVNEILGCCQSPRQVDVGTFRTCSVGGGGSSIKEEEVNLVPLPRFSWWDESHRANKVFGFPVSLPQAWRERTDANCLTDLHSVFMCSATVLWKVLCLKGNMPTHLMSRFQNSIVGLTEPRWSGRRIDTFCLLVVFKAGAHMPFGDARAR